MQAAGDGVGSMVAPVTDFGPVARVKIDFSDNDITGGSGLGGSSLETATITRSSSGITNLNPNAGLVNVAWQIATDRIGFGSAKVTLKYLDDELDGILGGESVLQIFTAPTLSDPWTKHPTIIDPARNEANATVTEFSFFAIGGQTLPNAALEWEEYQ